MTGSVVFGDVIQINGVDGDVSISLDRPPYRVAAADYAPIPLSTERARAQPSRLLLARHQIVPFSGRERTLDALATWVGGDEPIAVSLIHGAGGQGKTRLAAHVSTECAAAGWAVWQVTYTPTSVAGSAAAVSRVDLPGAAVLVIVDYADRWPASALLALLDQLRKLQSRAGTRVRVMMLARSDGYWWPALADRIDSDLGFEVDQWALPTLATDSDDERSSLFVTAATQFADALGLPPADWAAPDLTDPGLEQVLAVHMAALATVDAIRHGESPPTQSGGVTAYLLRREQAYWQYLHTRAEAPVKSPPELMHRTVLAATLTGTQPRQEARQALIDAGFADRGVTDRIIDDHAACYPPIDTRTVFEPLHPDLLGEDFLALSMPGHGRNGIVNLERDWAGVAITNMLTSGSAPAWASTSVTVLVETAQRWPHIATSVLYPLLLDHPELAIAAGGATLTRLVSLPDVDPALLRVLEPLLPDRPHVDLDVAVAAISTILTKHRLASAFDPAERARLLVDHAQRLSNAGRHDDAVGPVDEAVGIYRLLAVVDPPTHIPNLAWSLGSLGNRLRSLGRREEALAAAQESVDIYRRLAEADPEAYLAAFALALLNLGNPLSELGHREEAVVTADEAVWLYRQLVEKSPKTHLPRLGGSLTNLGLFMSKKGRWAEALGPAREAVAICRQLAAANPEAHLPTLASSLNSLGIAWAGLGHWEDAFVATAEAVGIYRRLAQANPTEYLTYLAMSLTNLSNRLARLGRWEEAPAPAGESVRIYRQLAEANPKAHLSGFAMSLNNFGSRLSELGHREEAVVAADEAVNIFRRLAEANPTAYLPSYAMASTSLGMFLSKMTRGEEAFAATKEAERIYRLLANADPSTYLASLALSVDSLGICLSELGHREDAVVAADEAVGLYRRLAEANPTAHFRPYAMSLTSLGVFRSELQDTESVNVGRKAVDLCRQLSAANPVLHRPAMAKALWSYARMCLNVKSDLRQGLEAVTEAITLYQQLAAQLPRAYAEPLSSARRTSAEILEELGAS